jgi:hypothetical protein
MNVHKVPRLLLLLTSLVALNAHAIEPKALKDVDISALTTETQQTTNADGVHIAWWIPPEFWQVAAMSNGGNPDSLKALNDIMSKYSMLAIAQAEISPFGAFTFYDRDKVSQGLKIELTDGKETQVLEPMKEVPDDLQMLLKIMAPMLESALGNMGKHINFFVLTDAAKEGRLISPYGNSRLAVTLTAKNGPLKPFVFEMPLNSLYVPRICPNGKPAHVSWVVCPWDGSKLPK